MRSLNINEVFYDIQNIIRAEFILEIDIVDQGVSTEVVERRT